jgi:hypothetical protein
VTPAAKVLTQSADLRLRGSVPARVVWPPATHSGAPPLIVLLSQDESVAAELSVRMPAVVLAVRPEGARTALDWASDHAAELGADPRRLIVAGEPDELIAALAEEGGHRERGREHDRGDRRGREVEVQRDRLVGEVDEPGREQVEEAVEDVHGREPSDISAEKGKADRA